MFDRPRNWKWMVPGALVGPCLVWWSQWAALGEPWVRYAPIPMALTLVLGLAALFNLVLYVYHYSADMYAGVRASQNNTPEVRMFEAARGMHPEAVRALLLQRRTLWRIKYVPVKDLVDWVLDEAPNVHAGFVDFVLERSSGTALMSKRLLSEGSKRFDPDDQVTDYEQYDSLMLLLQAKLMVTGAFGNQAPQWLPPWNPDTVRHRFGLDGAVAGEPEAMSEALMKVVRSQNAEVRMQKADAQRGRSVVEEALEGLEQTAEMKRRVAGLLGR